MIKTVLGKGEEWSSTTVEIDLERQLQARIENPKVTNALLGHLLIAP